MPPAIRPLASARTWSRNCCAETSAQPAGPLREYSACTGSLACCSSRRSVTLLPGSSSTSSPVLASLTAVSPFRVRLVPVDVPCNPALDPGRHPHPEPPILVGDGLG